MSIKLDRKKLNKTCINNKMEEKIMKRKTITLLLAAAMAVSGTACSAMSPTSTTEAYRETYSTTAADYVAECTTVADYYGESEEACADYEGSYSTEPAMDFNTEEYNSIKENGFVDVANTPLSTFAADVDTGSYCNLRRLIRNGWDLDNVASSIRTEEMVNYFDYKVDDSDKVFSVQYSVGDCPWNEQNKLLILTMQANAETNVPNEGNNFVFLIDSSGSMESPDKMPLVKESFKLLAGTLGPKDRVSIVTYSGSSETLLRGSNDYNEICRALDKIEPWGGTNGSGGICAAYDCAVENFVENGNNRVIIASDGDMNLGITSQSGLTDLIKEKK